MNTKMHEAKSSCKKDFLFSNSCCIMKKIDSVYEQVD